jgi:lysozyme family protein
MLKADANEAFVREVQRRIGVKVDGWAGPATVAAFVRMFPGLASVAEPVSRFAECLPLILKHEGGYVDHPRDPGGATNLGVTIGALSDWLGRPATKAEVKALTVADVAPIYEARYWRAAGCNRLPKGLDYAVFDFAVNSGPGRAVKFMQTAAGVVADGAVGPNTLAAVERVGALEMVRRVQQSRENFLRSLGTFRTFGKGWMRRVDDVTRQALEWAQ